MHGRWEHGGGFDGWWIPQLILMALLIGSVAWLVVTALRRNAHPATPLAPPPPTGSSPQEVLALRLANGEIEPDDYRARLEALAHTPSPPSP